MKSVKQAIIIRRDLKLRKEEYASLAASVSMKFVFDNNESDRADKLLVTLSPHETQWIKESSPKSVLGIDSEDALQDLAFRAEMMGASVYIITTEQSFSIKDKSEIVCVAIGPDEENVINQITGHLKPI